MVYTQNEVKLAKLLSKKNVQLLIVGMVLILAGLFIGKNSTTDTTISPSENSKENKNIFRVIRIIDGDTIQIENGKTVRYIGIDTPELSDSRKPVECFAKEAAEFNKNLVEGQWVRLEKDVSETDKYGRLLRYVYVVVFEGKIFVNDYLVRQGFAHAATFPPDVKYQNKFLDAQKEARENKRGLWGSC